MTTAFNFKGKINLSQCCLMSQKRAKMKVKKITTLNLIITISLVQTKHRLRVYKTEAKTPKIGTRILLSKERKRKH